MKKTEILKLIKNLDLINNYGISRSLVQLRKEIDIYFACKNKKINLKTKTTELLKTKRKVQIGGGGHILKDFINIDLHKPADIICDVRMGLPLPSESVNFIFNEHFLEHIDYPFSVNNFFLESRRVLAGGGKLVIGVPDAGFAIKKYLKNSVLGLYKKRWYSKRKIYKDIDCGIDIVNMIFRDEDFDEKYNRHYWGYDEEKIKKLFQKYNFSKIKKWNFDNQIANPKRKFGSIYIEGCKK